MAQIYFLSFRAYSFFMMFDRSRNGRLESIIMVLCLTLGANDRWNGNNRLISQLMTRIQILDVSVLSFQCIILFK